MNRLHGPVATTPVVTARSSETGAGLERLAEAADLPVAEPGCAEDDPDGHRPGGSTRAQTRRVSRRVGR